MDGFLAALLGAKAALVLVWFLALFILERRYPAVSAPGAPGPLGEAGSWRRLGRNGGLWALNTLLSPLVVVPLTALAAALAPGWGLKAVMPLSGGLGLLSLGVYVLLLDGLIYWWHRINHEWPLLWRFHGVHHLDCHLDTTTALRFHFGEVLLSALARAGVVVVLGVPLAAVLVFETLVLLAALFHHSNLRLAPAVEFWLAPVIITPGRHWLHHHDRRQDTDSNYGTILSVWDLVWGTRNRSRRWPAMTLGVEGAAEESLPRLLLRPFRGREDEGYRG